MKRTTAAALSLCLLLMAAAAHDADAGRRGKDRSKKLSKERTEKTEEMKQPRRFDRAPSMSFEAGMLQSDGLAGWRVGETKVQLAPNCHVDLEGQDGAVLTAGREVRVMGPRFGDTILAWQISMVEPAYGQTRSTTDVTLLPSEANPDVGEIVKAPH